ncbi:MAG: hypothetical protein FJ344_02010 [Sphingomonadales bacterium]|nr:hypothetical protein [Sphingomonadales bacterium]
MLILCLFVGVFQGCGEFKNIEEDCEHGSEMRAGKEPEPKPMARMMRAMYQQGEQMRKQILAGDSISPDAFPLLNYHNQIPTDPSVLGAEFDRHHAEFAQTWAELMKSPDPIRYNMMLQACVGCHQDHCPGPIKKIRKLSIEP